MRVFFLLLVLCFFLSTSFVFGTNVDVGSTTEFDELGFQAEFITNSILLDSISSQTEQIPKKGALLPGQSCPVSFGASKKIAASKAAKVTKAAKASPSASSAKSSVGKAVASKPATAAKPASIAKPAPKRKSRKSKAARFQQILGPNDPSVPALTPEQLAKCAEDKAKFDAAKAAPRGKGVGGQKFTSLVNGATNSQIWAQPLPPKVASALADYNSKKKLPNGFYYGQAAREVSLIGKTAAQVEAALAKFKCVKDMQQIKNATTSQPILDAAGKPIPMIVFICPEGSAFRLKPEGDSTSKFRPQPHGVKALRHPYNGPFLTFDDEVIKVDSEGGNPLPKVGGGLVNWFPDDKAAQGDAMDAWANRAHADLKK
jgi:hypothetical protein